MSVPGELANSSRYGAVAEAMLLAAAIATLSAADEGSTKGEASATN